MLLNTIKPAVGAKRNKKRVGRGIGCGNGKTCGRGHKGQTARSGYSKKIGFEGGQLPLQRRLPKFGFTSLNLGKVAEVRLSDLQRVASDIIDLKTLKDSKVIKHQIRTAKIILSGDLNKAVTIRGIKVTSGARKVIEERGGKVE
jgi:large subunit ribosomal protein L15